MFVIHDGAAIQTIEVAKFGELIEWLMKNRSGDGWCSEVMEAGANFKSRFPSLQFKARVRVKKILTDAPYLFETVYPREPD